MRFNSALFCLALTSLAPLQAQAVGGIFGFVDEDGVEHLSNIPDDKRYRLVLADRFEPARTALRAPRGVLALPYGQRPFHDSVMRASSESGVDAKLLHAVITVESGYNQGAVSPKGATGLMQLLPGTAKRYGTVNLLDPGENIRAGARYLRDLLAMFDNNLELALAAYNAGENAVIRHGRRLPPYAETRRYVPLVVAHYRRMQGS
ncbi:lytic transglycosylase domain-containing protein [Ferribacterium limneticum]|uniref:lytic transglycosylase domain-containing protein n=1 Tax=Ferribacterium limneticum TaxID=76259 RepID=UPI001CFACF3D|nr:lytic transglycosylase domain-containing protein [Ferribacterium limneticum]UCV17949.1 lytic transglycosylase domain-containing protein [Ferribacterium limneticum]